jgi:hypothetical protein
VLIVSKIAFKEGSTWSFFEQGATVVAKVEDEAFWQQVHDHTIKFGEGDRLKVRLHWKLEEKDGKLRQRNRIIKVFQVFDRPKQLRLEDRKEDEVKPLRPSRMIRLDDE